MNTYYISLVKDLLGTYIVATADSVEAVRYYLANEYKSASGEWKLPWCSIYKDRPLASQFETPLFIHSRKAKNLLEENEKIRFELREKARSLPDEDTNLKDED